MILSMNDILGGATHGISGNPRPTTLNFPVKGFTLLIDDRQQSFIKYFLLEKSIINSNSMY